MLEGMWWVGVRVCEWTSGGSGRDSGSVNDYENAFIAAYAPLILLL